jgi:hypothetical protein
MNEEQVAHWKKYLMGKIYVGDQMGMLDTDKV